MPNLVKRTGPLTALAQLDQNTQDRLGPYLEWAGSTWIDPDLAEYRDHLFARGLSPNSVQAHLSTIRSSYQKLLRDNNFREQLLAMLPEDLSMADRLAMVNEKIERIRNAVHPQTAPVKMAVYQDREAHVRLNDLQISALLAKPDRKTLGGLRDFAMIRLMLGTGLREAEVADLEVRDLYKEYDAYPALEVRSGKGKKQRMVLYGVLYEWVLGPVEDWLSNIGIEEGPVFCSLTRTGTIRSLKMNKRSIDKQILAAYPITHQNKPYTVKPHDLRYTYARRMYDFGMPLEALSRNMGHSSSKTTMIYVGDIGAHLRAPGRNPYE